MRIFIVHPVIPYLTTSHEPFLCTKYIPGLLTQARGDGSGPIVIAIVVIIAIVIAAAGGEVADEEDVQQCDVQCLTLFFQHWHTWDSRRKKRAKKVHHI